MTGALVFVCGLSEGFDDELCLQELSVTWHPFPLNFLMVYNMGVGDMMYRCGILVRGLPYLSTTFRWSWFGLFLYAENILVALFDVISKIRGKNVSWCPPKRAPRGYHYPAGFRQWLQLANVACRIGLVIWETMLGNKPEYSWSFWKQWGRICERILLCTLWLESASIFERVFLRQSYLQSISFLWCSLFFRI